MLIGSQPRKTIPDEYRHNYVNSPRSQPKDKPTNAVSREPTEPDQEFPPNRGVAGLGSRLLTLLQTTTAKILPRVTLSQGLSAYTAAIHI
jgi:hypothetical protein